MKKKSAAIITTLVAVILCGLAIYVGVRIVDIVKERDALKEAASAEAAESTETGLAKIPTAEEDAQPNTEALVFVEEETNDSGAKIKVYRDSEHNEYKYNEDGRLIGTMSNDGALSFLKLIPDEYADLVLYDPPYSITQAAQLYKGFGKEKLEISEANMRYWSECKNNIARILRRGGRCMCFGWNTNGIGKNRGFEMTEILIVSYGGSKNDTLCTLEYKL